MISRENSDALCGFLFLVLIFLLCLIVLPTREFLIFFSVLAVVGTIASMLVLKYAWRLRKWDNDD
ncbi:hypothetical protein LCGC14_0338580 [marine sediment metagenome]|uniref:Uncharacterized protein n=1 Tax=marine sediment metagenome TaxID=412755 RepID=A0A0F9TK31_9ZZZZ